MRAAILGFALLCPSAAVAAAQTNAYQVAPNATLAIQRPHILDGVWRVGGFGDLTLATRPNGVLEGQLAQRPCHGQYLDNAFSIFCESDRRGPVLISGHAAEIPPETTTARARFLAGGARMFGQIHQTYLSSRGHTEEVGEFTANRR